MDLDRTAVYDGNQLLHLLDFGLHLSRAEIPIGH